MKIKELISVLSSPDNLRIMRGEQQVYIGYLANLNNRGHEIDWQRAGLTGEEEVKSFTNKSHRLCRNRRKGSS